MDLQTFFDTGASSIPLALLSTDLQLVNDIQGRLIQLGLLDPPVDGKFGPVSTFALKALCERVNVPLNDGISTAVAKALLDAPVQDQFPLRPQADFAGRVVRAMLARGYWLGRHPQYRNIVYVEGCNPDGTPNDNKPNRFNDSRLVISVNADGIPTMLDAWDGTTEPGKKWTINPMDPKGAARIAFGQYKAWTVGIHNSNHEALRQVADVTVFRDLNMDFQREGDTTYTGVFFINQHWGYNFPPDDISTAGAGCLVGRLKNGHKRFMSLIKEDPSYAANHGYRFISTVMPVSDLVVV